MSTIRSPFSRQVIMHNFSSLVNEFCQFFTWTALGDVDLRFPLMLARKVNVVEEETR